MSQEVVQFIFSPKHSHEQSLKLIGICLLKAHDSMGLILTPASKLDIDVYPDVDHAGFYGYDDSLDPMCV